MFSKLANAKDAAVTTTERIEIEEGEGACARALL